MGGIPDAYETFNGEVDIPTDMPSTFTGKNARFQSLVTAGLELPGNNPDSGWKEIAVV